MEYAILEKEEDGQWIERGKTEAPDPISAIERSVGEPGTYAAIPVKHFVELEVEERLALKVRQRPSAVADASEPSGAREAA